MEDKPNENEIEKASHDKTELNIKKSSIDEKLNNQDSKRKTKEESFPVKIQKKTKKKKKNFPNKKRLRICMYLVLTIFCSLLLIYLIISHLYFQNEIKLLLEKYQKLAYLLFIIFIAGSLILSGFVSFCDCILKSHFLGILFSIILNLSIGYCILFSSKYFEQLLCSLIVLISGSLGLLFISLIIKNNTPPLIFLFSANGIFSIIAGIILFFIYNKFWNTFFSVLTFIISELNIYSSQFEFGNKEKKSDTLIYSQPFELIISIFKFFYLILYFFRKVIKIIYRALKSKKKKGKTNIEETDKKEEDINENDKNDSEDENRGEVKYDLEENKKQVEVNDSLQEQNSK